MFTYLRSNGLPFTDQDNYTAISFKDEFSSRDDRLRQTVKGPSYRMNSGSAMNKVADIVNNVAPTGYHPIKFVEDAASKDNKAKNENTIRCSVMRRSCSTMPKPVRKPAP